MISSEKEIAFQVSQYKLTAQRQRKGGEAGGSQTIPNSKQLATLQVLSIAKGHGEEENMSTECL